MCIINMDKEIILKISHFGTEGEYELRASK